MTHNKKLQIAGVVAITVFGFFTYTFASPTSNFQLTISSGTLAVDIVDGSYTPIANPTVVLAPATFNFACQSTTGVFGSATEQIYVQNPDAADNGWVVSLAASAPTAVWDSAGTDMDFNDASGAPLGCTDGADADSLAGLLSINPTIGTLAVGGCASCTISNISLGSANYFDEGVTNSITILTGANTSDDIGDWTLRGVGVAQQIPAEQPAAADYNINMTLSIVAN